MKKKIIIIICLIIGVGAIYMGWNVFKKIQHRIAFDKKLDENTPMPAFTFKTLDSLAYTKDDLKPGTPVMVFYYNPTCDHCQEYAANIQQQLDLFRDTQILMVSPEPADMISEFVTYFGFDTLKNVSVIRDEKDEFFGIFGAAYYPTIFAYNKDHRLKGHYRVSAGLDAIRNAMNRP